MCIGNVNALKAYLRAYTILQTNLNRHNYDITYLFKLGFNCFSQSVCLKHLIRKLNTKHLLFIFSIYVSNLINFFTCKCLETTLPNWKLCLCILIYDISKSAFNKKNPSLSLQYAKSFCSICCARVLQWIAHRTRSAILRVLPIPWSLITNYTVCHQIHTHDTCVHTHMLHTHSSFEFPGFWKTKPNQTQQQHEKMCKKLYLAIWGELKGTTIHIHEKTCFCDRGCVMKSIHSR